MSILFKRRSIRKFKNKPIDEETVKLLLKGAMSAPSAGNQKPWHFVVINDRNILNEIPKFHQYSQMLKEAPLAIAICGITENIKYPEYCVQDCSAATENLLIAITELGLGGVWLGIYPREDRIIGLSRLLNLPEGVLPLSVVSIGYADEEKEPIDRYMEDRVHYNKW
ncbi:nitroreductase family protein [Serpentinicella alkaliphila]|uniref:Nitroreductase n=1 Tax=Serpentinicella alkaliphila TaxID=1734049 RepID=A0A4R2T767_9FIRM|nr:nitroreductase family protein [Serpentinicella alkaliphila]QUH25600.1 nitroreductase family protein [Serpentinicella alkaliphila]TCP98380.1 nitroreductase [Serpentinicella alkaliphila]